MDFQIFRKEGYHLYSSHHGIQEVKGDKKNFLTSSEELSARLRNER
ncbi:MAG: hypothetical protein ACTSRP_17810 [Candidatus Helarchaeota archaeon]